jgi:hypothetical protein
VIDWLGLFVTRRGYLAARDWMETAADLIP